MEKKNKKLRAMNAALVCTVKKLQKDKLDLVRQVNCSLAQLGVMVEQLAIMSNEYNDKKSIYNF